MKHVDLPADMQRAMARQAEAEREKRAKIIHAAGELEASEKLAQAATVIAVEPVTITLRYLQTLTEIASEKNSTIIFPLPIELLNLLGTHPGQAGRWARDARARSIAPHGRRGCSRNPAEREAAGRPVHDARRSCWSATFLFGVLVGRGVRAAEGSDRGRRGSAPARPTPAIRPRAALTPQAETAAPPTQPPSTPPPAPPDEDLSYYSAPRGSGRARPRRSRRRPRPPSRRAGRRHRQGADAAAPPAGRAGGRCRRRPANRPAPGSR